MQFNSSNQTYSKAYLRQDPENSPYLTNDLVSFKRGENHSLLVIHWYIQKAWKGEGILLICLSSNELSLTELLEIDLRGNIPFINKTSATLSTNYVGNA
jgi:hypothetical protein